MLHMLRVATWLGMLSLAYPVGVGAQAAPFDHLKCYSIKDGLVPTRYTADLIPRNPPFQPELGCVVSRAKLYCTNVRKENVSPPAPGSVSGGNAGDYVCYQVRCPRAPVDPPRVEDQFGDRRLAAVGSARWLCAPANQIEPATPTPTPTSTPTPVPTQIPFSATGAMQTWTVPAGVTAIQVDARGAQGGNGPGGATGGLGGRVEATIAVTPGQVLNIFVGAKGQTPQGGWNGGGNGGNGTNGGNGGGGGGASDIRIGGVALTDRVLAAAGGGGVGVDARTGGAGGGLTGGVEVPVGGNGGGGGTQTAGGSGGSGLSCQGNPGSAGLGGSGGTGCNGATGGGGGGFYGGGGAGSSECGGGGSSLVPAGGTTTSGFQANDGAIVISY